MLIGYARVSTEIQDTDMQLRALKAAGVAKIEHEKASGAAERPTLERLLTRLKPGDVLIAYKVDRLARSLYDLMRVLKAIEAAGATFRSVTEPIETSTAAGRLMVQMLGAFAEFERSLMKERCASGIDAAMARGVRFGRPPALTDAQREDVKARFAQGELIVSIARSYGLSKSTIARTVGTQPRQMVPRRSKPAPCQFGPGL